MMATPPAASAAVQPASSTIALAATRTNAGIGCCSSSFSAPLWRSPDTWRMATNGRRKAAASSHALKVGAQTPTNGENASPTPADVPFSPLASAYVRTALMNDTPTSGPIASSMIHHDRDATSSRASLRSSHTSAALREGKEYLFQVAAARGSAARRGERRQFVDRALAADAAAAQQDEPIADARGVVDLVDRQEQRDRKSVV